MKRIINHQQQNRSEGLTSTFPKNGKKTFKNFRRCKALLVNTSEHLFSPKNGLRLCKCCAKTVLKKFKCLIIRHLTLEKVGSGDKLSNFISDFEKVVLFIKANNY